MSDLSNEIVQRIRRLGFQSEDTLPVDRLVSAVRAVACLPMYMVSNVHGWTSEGHFEVVGIKGSEAVREAYAIGREKADIRLDEQHEKMLSTFLGKDHPADRIIYEHAVETLRMILDESTPEVADELRAAIAKGIVSVANAAGKGLLGRGPKVSDAERACIAEIVAALGLERSGAARATLATLEG